MPPAIVASRWARRWFGLMLLALCGVSRALGHGDVHLEIERLTAEITRHPKKAELFLRRGELWRVDGNWKAAEADFDRVARLSPKLAAVDFYRGRLQLESGRLGEARSALDKFLQTHPVHTEALLTRARTHARLSQHENAAGDFSRVIASTTEPRPEFFLEWADALAAAGPPRVAEAVRCLAEGMSRLGPVVTLQLRAIELEVARKDFDAALARVDEAAAHAPRQETWLLRRGEILLLAGRVAEARAAFAEGLACLGTLPDRQQKTAASQTLAARLRELAGVPQPSAVSQARP